jgi:sugar/nucleoside kinase (ribokinase family)
MDQINQKITMTGDVCIDHNEVNGRKYVSWGSSLMYMAKYLSTHTDYKIELIATHGKDFNTYADTVKISNQPLDLKTLIYNNIVIGDVRTQYCYNSESSAPVGINEELIKSLNSTSIFIFAPLTPNYKPEYIAELLKYVPASSLKVLSPQGYMRQIDAKGQVSRSKFLNEENIIPFFDIIVASDEDCDDAIEAAKHWVTYKETLNVIITQNKSGATLINSAGLQHIETVPVPTSDIVDSVGSGDVFTAQLVVEYFSSRNIIQAIESGNHAAREKLLSNVATTIA